MKKKYIETKITTLSQKEFIKFRVFDNLKIDYLNLIYGFILNPPISYKMNESSIVIHTFFVNEFEIANTFKTICKKLVKQLNLDDDVIINKFETGHSEIKSKSLSTYFKEIDFESKMSIYNLTNYFSSDIYRNITDEQKFSYLLGKYIRFYRENKFVLLDSWENYIVIDVIKSFCIGQDNLRSETFFGVPGIMHLTLNDDSTLLEYLKIWSEVMKE